MRERKERRQRKKLDLADSWIGRYGISAMDWKRKYSSITYLRYDDWRTGTYQYYISDKDFAHSVTIIIFSAAAFGAGIGQCLYELFAG